MSVTSASSSAPVKPLTRSCVRLPVTFRAEDSPRGLWRSLGKRVGCKPSRVRIPHPPPLPPGETLRPTLPAGGAGQASSQFSSQLASSGPPLLRPQQATDPVGHITPALIRHVLIARGHRRARPPHDAHHRPLGDAQDQQHGRRRAPRIVQPAIGYAGRSKERLPIPVIRVETQRLAQRRGKHPAAFLPELASPGPLRVLHGSMSQKQLRQLIREAHDPSATRDSHHRPNSGG